MRAALRRRFWVETGFTGLATILALVTLVRRDWIELAFGLDPDKGSGALEWVIVAGLVAVIIGLSALARAEWSTAKAATVARLSA